MKFKCSNCGNIFDAKSSAGGCKVCGSHDYVVYTGDTCDGNCSNCGGK